MVARGWEGWTRAFLHSTSTAVDFPKRVEVGQAVDSGSWLRLQLATCSLAHCDQGKGAFLSGSSATCLPGRGSRSCQGRSDQPRVCGIQAEPDGQNPSPRTTSAVHVTTA